MQMTKQESSSIFGKDVVSTINRKKKQLFPYSDEPWKQRFAAILRTAANNKFSRVKALIAPLAIKIIYYEARCLVKIV